MAVNLTIRSGTTRSYPNRGDEDLYGEATSWANDVTTAINASPTSNITSRYDAIVGSAANVTAGIATHSDIATAIAAVSANDRIYLLENTYEPAAQIDITKAVTIIGQGEGAIVEGDNLATGAVIKISASGVTLENFKIIQGSGTPTYALEIAASKERINLNLKADGTFSTGLFLNGSVAGAVTGFISYDTNSVLFGGESQMVEQLKLEDQTTTAYNLVLQSNSDASALSADRILTFDVNNAARTIDLASSLTIGTGGTTSITNMTITAEDAASAVVFDNTNFEVENTNATQRNVKITSAKAGDTTLTFQENLTIGDGYDLTITAEDAASAVVLDNANLEIENTDGTQRNFKITSAKAGDTTLTLQENLTISDGYDVTIVAEDAASSITLDEQTVEFEGEGTATRLMKFVNLADAAATLSISGTNGKVDQDVRSGAGPAFTSGTLTTFDIDGGTASNAARITLPSNTKANLDALTRKEGTIVYGTDTNAGYLDNGSTLDLISVADTVIPIGSIVPWIGGYFGDGSNGSFTNVLGNTVADVNTYLGAKWKVCNGASLNEASSPIFNGAGRYLPNISDSRFLQGGTTAGSIGGSNTMIDHTHSFSLTAAGQSHSSTPTSSSNSGSHAHAFMDQWETGRDDGGALVAGLTDSGTYGATRNSSGNHTHTVDIGHTHAASSVSGSVGTGVGATSTNVRPLYLQVFYVMRVY